RKAGKLRTRSRVQIPQQPIAKPVARHRAQLLLDQLERTPKRRSAPQSLLNINPAHIQPHRIETGEPAHRARKIDIPRHLLPPRTPPPPPAPERPAPPPRPPPPPQRPTPRRVSTPCGRPKGTPPAPRANTPCVPAAGSASVTRPAVPIVSRAASSEPSTSDS